MVWPKCFVKSAWLYLVLSCAKQTKAIMFYFPFHVNQEDFPDYKFVVCQGSFPRILLWKLTVACKRFAQNIFYNIPINYTSKRKIMYQLNGIRDMLTANSFILSTGRKIKTITYLAVTWFWLELLTFSMVYSIGHFSFKHCCHGWKSKRFVMYVY